MRSVADNLNGDNDMAQQRTADERAKELEAKIAAIRSGAERKTARANPAVRLTLGAVKLLDKALNATADAVARRTIEEARQSLGAYVATHGWTVPIAGATATKATPTKATAPVKRGRRKAVTTA